MARRGHNTPEVSCSRTLEEGAQAWANELKDRAQTPDCKFFSLIIYGSLQNAFI